MYHCPDRDNCIPLIVYFVLFCFALVSVVLVMQLLEAGSAYGNSGTETKLSHSERGLDMSN